MVQRRFSRLFRGLAVVVLTALAMPAVAAAGPLKLVVLGDSLTAGLGVAPSEAFPAQLEAALRARGHAVELVNAGVSGDTVADGLARFDWSIPDDAAAVIVELGANDALRGIAPAKTRAALDALLARLKNRNLPVLLAGMKPPRNWGNDYKGDFEIIYTDLASHYGAALYPFFLEGVALDPALNQADGLHPTAKGVAVIVARMLPAVEELLGKIALQP